MHFRPYLYGRKFIIKTDHRPLVYLFSIKNPTSKLTRMRLELEEFDFSVQYVQGKTNVGADALSRVQIDSDILKNMTILQVTTRSMKNNIISNQKKYSDMMSSKINENNEPKAIEATNNSEVYYLPKLVIEI